MLTRIGTANTACTDDAVAQETPLPGCHVSQRQRYPEHDHMDYKPSYKIADGLHECRIALVSAMDTRIVTLGVEFVLIHCCANRWTSQSDALSLKSVITG